MGSDRDGFGYLKVLECLCLRNMNIKKRSAKIYAEVIGYGLTGDAYHPTAPSEDENGGLRAMNMALKDAKIDSDLINYINAHGTSTHWETK